MLMASAGMFLIATSLDHVLSISGTVFCGFLWKAFGYQYVFLFAAGIAVVNLFSAMRIRIPDRIRMPEGERTGPRDGERAILKG